MARFRKKPVVIDAWKTDINLPNLDLPQDLRPAFDDGQWYIYDFLHDTSIKFEIGDWIIRGVKGECYPCKPDVFGETYESFD